MLRNVASQKWRVYAWDTTTGAAKTGDAASISAYITKDYGTPAATNDAAPTEASSANEPGYYDFDLTQAETSAARVTLSPKSATADIAVIACPPVVDTIPQYLSLFGIASDGDMSGNIDGNVVGSVGSVVGHTPQTGDNYAIVNSGTHGNAALKTLIDAVQADLPQRITKNTALAAFPFLMVDATDLSTPETGLTITATRSLDGAAFGACANAVTEIGTGWYKIDLAAGDLNGNTVALRFTAAGAATRNITLITQPT